MHTKIRLMRERTMTLYVARSHLYDSQNIRMTSYVLVFSEENMDILGTHFGTSLTLLVIGVRKQIKYVWNHNELNNKQK